MPAAYLLKLIAPIISYFSAPRPPHSALSPALRTQPPHSALRALPAPAPIAFRAGPKGALGCALNGVRVRLAAVYGRPQISHHRTPHSALRIPHSAPSLYGPKDGTEAPIHSFKHTT